MNTRCEEIWVAQATGLWRSATRRAQGAERWLHMPEPVSRRSFSYFPFGGSPNETDEPFHHFSDKVSK
jgi:hypothetical protein